ncbi:PTS glucose transporter subunit IIA [Niallia sp. BSM11]|uniref:PTS sugar transporter subunit IIA n=1 Tax=Niallia sp. BSM11 TaxID=3391576 RepID=UPI0039853146
MMKRKKAPVCIHSPISGEIIPLDSVPDPVFSRKVFGEGLAIIPVNGDIYAPITGTVLQISEAKHSIAIMTEEGLEVLLQLGLETEELNGEGFHILVKPGEKIHARDHIGIFNLSILEERGKEIISVLVFPNLEDKDGEIMVKGFGEVRAGLEIASINYDNK